MLMLLRLLVTAFDVFALGTAIYSTSLNYYYRCIGQIYRKPACYVNILNKNICFVKAFFDKKSNFVKKNGRKWRVPATAKKFWRLPPSACGFKPVAKPLRWRGPPNFSCLRPAIFARFAHKKRSRGNSNGCERGAFRANWRGGHTPAKIAPAVIGQLRTRYF